MRALTLAFLALTSLPISAASPTPAVYSCGYQVVKIGDSTGKLMQACGQPARTERIETREGGAVGTRYEYDRNGHTVAFLVSGGRVARIERL